jgi:hypothetical protein
VRWFEIPAGSPWDFVEKATAVIEGRGLAEVASLTLEGETLTVRLQWLGVSTLSYALSDRSQGFRADLVHERVSPLHRSFQHGFESSLGDLVANLGGSGG